MDDFVRFLDHWRRVVDQAARDLSDVDDSAARRKPAPRKWSIKEIVGHLIDSASNNHKRFVEAQAKDDLICLGYAQDAWVQLQRYQESALPGCSRCGPRTTSTFRTWCRQRREKCWKCLELGTIWTRSRGGPFPRLSLSRWSTSSETTSGTSSIIWDKSVGSSAAPDDAAQPVADAIDLQRQR
jgi:hypothetical protein